MRKRNIIYFNMLIVILIATFICLVFIIYSKKAIDEDVSIKERKTSPIETEQMPSVILNINNEGLNPNSYINAFVLRVVDGDTIVVKYKKNNYRVRLLDVDTPEGVKQGISAQPYSQEASQFTKKSLSNKEVKLVFERRLKDNFNRLLAYVIMGNNENFNANLVRNGYARVEIIKPNDLNKDYFNKLQVLAIQNKLGIWGLAEEKKPFIIDKDGKYVPRYLN